MIHEDDSIFELLTPVGTLGDPVDECAATVLDSDSEQAEDTVIEDTLESPIADPSAHAPSAPPEIRFQPSLCGLWEHSQISDIWPSSLVSAPSEDDSQLTAYDNPFFIKKTVVPLKQHYTQDPLFYDSVWKQIELYVNANHWFDLHDSVDRLTPSWEDNVEMVTNVVRSIVSSSTEFKIGITLDPRWRFFQCANGDYEKKFRRMTIVYVAPVSNPYRLHSTGMMEKALIAVFKGTRGCLNIADGGEGASKGSPHFLYIVHD